MNDVRWWIPLAPLFSTLLAGCQGGETGGCKSDELYSMETVTLTPAEYAEWSQGGPATTTGDPTTGGTTAATTGGSSTGADATTGGEPLTEQEICAAVCQHHGEGQELDSCSTMASADEVVITCTFVTYCVGGRMHACVRSQGGGAGPGPAALWLAHAAHDEAASVHAFVALGRELAAHGAPAELLAQVEAAAGDEVRHAEAIAALARDSGAEVTTPVCAEVPARDLLAIALENAVEGCVIETWAALSAAHQAQFAADPAVRKIFKRIAEDERRHAELAWAIDAWLCGQLDADARAEVALARRFAARRLIERLGEGRDAPELEALGLPRSATAARLGAGLDAALWSQAA